MKIANDLRWMNQGPLAGIGEIALPALQPGSSIMPGKVNPVIPEAVAMVCAQVIGNDATIAIAGQSGNFQLNVMLPVVAYNLLQSIEIAGQLRAPAWPTRRSPAFTVNTDNINRALDRNPILVTALNPVIGYEKGAAIAKKAYAEGRAVKDVAREMTDLYGRGAGSPARSGGTDRGRDQELKLSITARPNCAQRLAHTALPADPTDVIEYPGSKHWPAEPATAIAIDPDAGRCADSHL